MIRSIFFFNSLTPEFGSTPFRLLLEIGSRKICPLYVFLFYFIEIPLIRLVLKQKGEIFINIKTNMLTLLYYCFFLFHKSVALNLVPHLFVYCTSSVQCSIKIPYDFLTAHTTRVRSALLPDASWKFLTEWYCTVVD